VHFSLRRALWVACPALLGSALVVGAAALPASAQTYAALPASAQAYQDTALVGSPVSDATFGGSGIGAADDNGVIKLTGSGVTWKLHGTGTRSAFRAP
jgi:hypothetical protein